MEVSKNVVKQEIKEENENSEESLPSDDVKKRTCPVCARVFTRKRSMLLHLPLHERQPQDVNERTCTVCSKVFETRAYMKVHARCHVKSDGTDEKERTCPVCSKVFPKKNTMLMHCRGHDFIDDVQDRTCTECPKIFASNYAMKKHRRRKHIYTQDSVERRTCNICSKVCNTFSERNSHIKKIHGDPEPVNRRTCHLCACVYRSALHLNQHIQRIHTGNKKSENITLHPCHICSKKYKSAEKLDEHIRFIHNQENIRDRTCPICDKVLSSAHSVKRHLKSYHTKKEEDVADRTCPICSKVESSIDYLRGHIHTNHGDAKLFSCDFCCRAFITRLGLQAHSKRCLGSYIKTENIDTHKGKKSQKRKVAMSTTCFTSPMYRNSPLEIRKAKTLDENDVEYRSCSLCDKVCVTFSALENHFSSHHPGKYPFECMVCSKKFKLKKNFHKHLKCAKKLCKAERRMEYRKCAICYVQHNNKFLLKGHMSTSHRNAKPFVCTHCEVNFIFLDDFEKHLLKESSKCKNKKQMARLENYKNTIRKGKKKSYDINVDLEYRKCAICYNVHSHSDGLRRHMNKHHDGVKPFLCTNCSVGFKLLEEFEIHATDKSSKCCNDEQADKLRIHKNVIINGVNYKNKRTSDDLPEYKGTKKSKGFSFARTKIKEKTQR